MNRVKYHCIVEVVRPEAVCFFRTFAMKGLKKCKNDNKKNDVN